MSEQQAAAPPDPPDPPGPLHGLRLRPWRADDTADLDAIVAGRQDPEFRQWNTPNRPFDDRAGAERFVRTRSDAWARGTGVAFCVCEEGGDAPLGQVALSQIDQGTGHSRVGYWVLPAARGRGVATRGLDLLTRWAFGNLGLHRIELGHAVGHEASCTVARRAGFRYEGTLRASMFAAGRRDAFRDAHLHARLASDPPPVLP